MVTLSTSAYGTAALCLKRFQYNYELKLVPLPRNISRPSRRGTWIHRALEVYHSGGDWVAAVTALKDWCSEHGLEDEFLQVLYDEVVEVVQGYVNYWEPREPLHAIAAEERVEATVAGHTLTATIDMRAMTKYGHCIVETKSTENIPSATWRAIDPQTALQLAICWFNGMKVDGILFNYLWTKTPPVPRWKRDGDPYKVTLDSVTTTAAFNRGVAAYQRTHGDVLPRGVDELRDRIVNDGAYYSRYYVDRPVAAVTESLLDVGHTIEDLERAKRTGYYRRLNSLLVCQRFCPYSELCATEYALGRPADVLRSELFVSDDGVISREGVTR